MKNMKIRLSFVVTCAATKPASGAEGGHTAVKHNFKTAKDGRLIITEEDSDGETAKAKKKGNHYKKHSPLQGSVLTHFAHPEY